MVFCMTGGLASPPQSCHNSPVFPDTSLSAFVKPGDLLDSTEYSGDEVGQPEQREGGCPGRSRRLSLASSLSSLTTSVSPADEEEANKSKKSLLESSEDEDGDPITGVEVKNSSLDSLEEEEEVDPITVAEKTSLGDMLGEEEEEDHMIVTEKKTSEDLSEEEEEEEDEEDEEEEKEEEEENKSLEDTMEEKEVEPMPGIEEGNAMNIDTDSSVQLEEGNSMTIDADSSVQLEAILEPRRSSRNPQMINKPSVAWPKSPKVMKGKGKPAPKTVLLHVSVQIP